MILILKGIDKTKQLSQGTEISICTNKSMIDTFSCIRHLYQIITCLRHDVIVLCAKTAYYLRRDFIFCAKKFQTRVVKKTHMHRWWTTFTTPVHTRGNPYQVCKKQEYSFSGSINAVIKLDEPNENGNMFYYFNIVFEYILGQKRNAGWFPVYYLSI